MGDVDVMMANNASTARRYSTGNEKRQTSAAPVVPTVQRASRPTVEHQRPRNTIAYADVEPITNGTRPRPVQQSKPRTTQGYADDTNNDVQIAPSVRRLRDEKVQPTKKLPEQHRGLRFHWLLYVGVGMVMMLLIWILGVQLLVGWTNGMHDPGYYTQTAHLDTAMVTTDAQGHQSQVRAFVDAQRHLDLLVLPKGDMSKAHVIVGPALLFGDLNQVTLTVTAKGSIATILAQGPLQANYLATTRESSTWMYDLKQPATNGGH